MANQPTKSENLEKEQPPAAMQARENVEKTPGQYTNWMASPFSFMRRFSEEMDKLFEDFGFSGALSRSTGGRISHREFGRGLWNPPIEVFTRGDQLVVKAELPGMSKDDVKVECTDDAITIQGEKRQEQKEEHEGTFRSERSYGRFFRRIPLPEGAKVEEAKASFRDGILEITMKAPQQTHSRQITISE